MRWNTKRRRGRETEALLGKMANSLILCRPVLPTLGAGGGCSEGASGKNRVSLSSLHAPILFSGFPVYEEIVASRVTLPS